MRVRAAVGVLVGAGLLLSGCGSDGVHAGGGRPRVMEESALEGAAERRELLVEALRVYGGRYAELSRSFAAHLGLYATDATALLEIIAAEERGAPISPALLGGDDLTAQPARTRRAHRPQPGAQRPPRRHPAQQPAHPGARRRVLPPPRGTDGRHRRPLPARGPRPVQGPAGGDGHRHGQPPGTGEPGRVRAARHTGRPPTPAGWRLPRRPHDRQRGVGGMGRSWGGRRLTVTAPDNL